jgi:hypothetical protein
MLALNRAHVISLRVNWDSGVNRPALTMLNDINENIRNGDSDLAAKKLELLEKRWYEYSESFRERREFEKTPECFVDEITGLSD